MKRPERFFIGRDAIKPNQGISKNTHSSIKWIGKDATLIKRENGEECVRREPLRKCKCL